MPQRHISFLLVLFLAWVAPVVASAQPQGPPPKDAASAGRVAVLPFTNISGWSGDAWIGRGIAETVVADLEQAGAIAVVGPEPLTDELRRRGSPPVPQDDASQIELGRRLGVKWVLAGSYQRVADQVRITARVLNVESGQVTGTVKLDGTISQIFQLQDRIVRELGLDFERARVPAAAAPIQKPSLSAPQTGATPRTGATPQTGTTPQILVPAARGAPATTGAPPTTRSTGAPPDGAAAGPGRSKVDASALGRPADGVTGALLLDPAPPPAEVRAGIAPSAGILAGRPRVTASRVTTAPNIDGRLDDAAWKTATRITDFVQQRPVEGMPATEQTEVYVSYDNRNIYLGVYAHYSDRGLIRANRVDRDQIRFDDTVNIFFDPFLDQQRAYVLSVNGYGIQGDSLMSGGMGGMGMGGGGRGGGGGSGGGGGGMMRPGAGSGMPMGMGMGGGGGGGGMMGFVGDSSWDALFESAGHLVEDGWTAELAIPFKSLRYPARDRGELHRWGFQIQRDIRGKDESVVWAPVSRDVPAFLRQMGVLEGLTNLSTSRNLELMPTFTGVQLGTLNAANGAFGKVNNIEGGVNVKYGITSNLTLDSTYNPDFSQVETDLPQIEVNQRFPLFYPELRPFFLEGQEIFNLPGPVTFVHTRTIIDPRYGAKVTGKVGKTTLGFLVANDEAAGKVDDPVDPAFGRNANVVLGRVRYDMYSESSVGLIVTDREFLDTFSRVGGADGQFAIGRNHRVFARAIFSDHRDVEGVKRTGHYYDVGVLKEGRHLGYTLISNGISPDFRTDVGFVRRVDQRETLGNISYRFWPESWITNWGPLVNFERIYGYDGVLQDQMASAGVRGQFAKNIIAVGNFNRDMERFGGINFQKTRYFFGAGVFSSRRIGGGGFYSVGDQVLYVTDPYLGRGATLNVFVNLKPFSRLQSDINITTSNFVEPLTKTEIFDVKIFRARTTYQFTERFLVRAIVEHNTFDKSVGGNVLLTYRINSGTVFYVGYDDRYRQEDRINTELFSSSRLRRTNRAVFTKLQYLFRL